MKKAHPFPKYYIEAHSGSSVVVGCTGSTTIGAGSTMDEMERELLRTFRALTIKDKVKVVNGLYLFEERRRREKEKGHPADTDKMA